MYKFWYDYVKPKYSEKARFCYMDTDSFTVCVRTDDIYKDITEDKTRFETKLHKLLIRQTIAKRKKQNSYWFNVRWVSQKDFERICRIESKHL